VTVVAIIAAGLASFGGGGGLHAFKSLLSPLTLGRRR
jgi:hypothetical protein